MQISPFIDGCKPAGTALTVIGTRPRSSSSIQSKFIRNSRGTVVAQATP
jgi:hypothetical protein